METLHFNKLLLKTAFSCMACDGDIDKREVKLIKQLQKERKTFGEIDINAELDTLLLAINKDGHQFLKGYYYFYIDSHPMKIDISVVSFYILILKTIWNKILLLIYTYQGCKTTFLTLIFQMNLS